MPVSRMMEGREVWKLLALVRSPSVRMLRTLEKRIQTGIAAAAIGFAVMACIAISRVPRHGDSGTIALVTVFGSMLGAALLGCAMVLLRRARQRVAAWPERKVARASARKRRGIGLNLKTELRDEG